jgi:hypothetical protein
MVERRSIVAAIPDIFHEYCLVEVVPAFHVDGLDFATVRAPLPAMKPTSPEVHFVKGQRQNHDTLEEKTSINFVQAFGTVQERQGYTAGQKKTFASRP